MGLLEYAYPVEHAGTVHVASLDTALQGFSVPRAVARSAEELRRVYFPFLVRIENTNIRWLSRAQRARIEFTDFSAFVGH